VRFLRLCDECHGDGRVVDFALDDPVVACPVCDGSRVVDAYPQAVDNAEVRGT